MFDTGIIINQLIYFYLLKIIHFICIFFKILNFIIYDNNLLIKKIYLSGSFWMWLPSKICESCTNFGIQNFYSCKSSKTCKQFERVL